MRDAALDWLDGLFKSLEQATECEFRDWSALQTTVESLLWLDALVLAAQRLRPYLPEWSSLATMVKEFKSLLREYLGGLSASTPREAARAADRAQVHLSAAGDENQAILARGTRFEALGETENTQEAFDFALREAMDDASANNVIDLDESGREFLASIGVAEVSPGMGIAALLGAIEARYLYDEERFWRVVAEAYGLLLVNTARTTRLAEDLQWQQDLSRAAERQHDAFVFYGGALARAETSKHQVRALLDIALTLFEGPLKTYFSTLLALKGVASYDRLRRRDAGALLDLAGQHGLDTLLAGISKTLRAGRAHETFDLSGGDVLLGEETHREQMPVEVFLDAVLTGVESVGGLALAHLLLASHLNLDDVVQNAIAMAELTPIDWAHLVLRIAGWSDTDVEVEGDRLLVNGTPSEPPDLRTVAMLLPQADDAWKSVALAWEHEGHHVLEGSLEPMRGWRAADNEQEKLDSMIEAQRIWMLDGSTLISGDQVRKWVAVNLGQRMDELAALVSRGQQLKGLVGRLGDMEAVETVADFLGAARGRAMGLDPTPNQSAAAIRMSEWLELPGI